MQKLASYIVFLVFLFFTQKSNGQSTLTKHKSVKPQLETSTSPATSPVSTAQTVSSQNGQANTPVSASFTLIGTDSSAGKKQITPLPKKK